MQLTPAQIIMMSKIDKLRNLLVNALNNDKQLILWELAHEEFELIELLCLVENSDHSKTDDIFIELKANIDCGSDEYSNAIIDEFKEMQEKTNNLAKDNQWLLKNWDINKYKHSNPIKTRIADFFNDFLLQMPDFENKIILYLNPSQKINETDLIKWCSKYFFAETNARIIIMLSSVKNTFSEFHQSFDKISTILIPNLKMNEAIKQMATAGNPSAPDVQFRKCILNMSDGVAQKNEKAIIDWHEKAIDICKKYKWEDMAITAHLCAGTFLLNISNYQNSIPYFLKAKEKSEQLLVENNPLAPGYILQVNLILGSAYYANHNFQGALDCYNEIINKTDKKNNLIHFLEAYRISALCYEKLGYEKMAIQNNWNAIHVAELMDQEARQHTTINYVGEELIKLTRGNAAEQEVVNQSMNKLIGDAWRI